MKNISSQKFFLYARKSTDVEDKQVLSIEAQLAELRAFAKNENISIVEELIEKQSAKTPGRPIFNSMLNRIEKGEANGIISWHPDRLARNSVDGGKIIYLLDIGKLAMLKFNTFWFDNTPQGKFMLNIAFGQSKYYVDSLSENTKRGLRQKVRRGEYPGLAPIGYLNHSKTKKIVVHKKHGQSIKELFEFYAEGSHSMVELGDFLAERDVFTKFKKKIYDTRLLFILQNPFYYGFFRYAGELYEGKHEPIITKKLFDQVQVVLKKRGKPRYKAKPEPQAFCGLLSCANCGMMVTGEYRIKRQINGNEHHYIYYHCSKKSKTIKCDEPCIRQEALDRQISPLLQKISLPIDWAEKLREKLEKDKTESSQSVFAFVQESQKKIDNITDRLQRLLDGYLEQDIEKEVYRKEKARLLSEKKTLEERMKELEHQQNDWIEPMEQWINYACTLKKISRDSNLFEKKVAAEKAFGSNLRLAQQTVVVQREENITVERKNQWTALRAAHNLVGKIDEFTILEPSNE